MTKRPKKPFDKKRIDEEAGIKRKYGLKNKKEIWKAEAEISKVRRRAKELIPKTEEERQEFFVKLTKIGFDVKDTSDVLGLTKEDQLERRLQTFVFKKKLAQSIRQARQLITHKNVFVDGKVVNKPAFVVSKDLEGKISLKEQKAKPKKVEKVAEAPKADDGKEEKPVEKSEDKKEEVKEEKKNE